MQNTYLYPIVAEKTETGVSMYFPDFSGTAITSHNVIDGIRQAKEMLINRLLELEENDEKFPNPSNPENIELLDTSDHIIFVEVFMPDDANKTVTKNCTLPKWLRDAGEEAGLNFSQLLQYAIKESLGIHSSRDEKRAQ